MKKFLFYVPMAMAVAIFVFFGKGQGEFFGINTAFGYGGGGSGGGGAPFTPIITSVGVPLTINSTQSGVLSYNLDTSGNAVVLNVPKGSVQNTATFKIVGASMAGFEPANGSAIGYGVYTITATDSSNNPLNSFSHNLTITFEGLVLPADVSNVGVYYLDETTNEWVLVTGSVFNTAAGTVTFTVDHLTKFAVLNATSTLGKIKAGTGKTVTFTISFRTGLTATQKQKITNLVNSGRLFSTVDAKNYAYATGQSNWQQFVGKNPKAAAAPAQPSTTEVSGYKFTKFLTVGSVGAEVRALQQKLKDLGYFTYPSITGNYGSATKAAVVKYQKDRNLKPYPGYVGPGTRAALNAE